MAYGVVGGGVVGDLREVNARSLARVQGALARPGERRTERAGAKRQTFHGHGTRGKRDGWDK